MAIESCGFYESQLIKYQGIIGEQIYKETYENSVWSKFTKQEAFPDGLGDTLSVMVSEMSLPANTLTWTAMTQNSDTGNDQSCGIAGQNISFAQTLRQYSPSKAAINSPCICLDKIRFNAHFEAQMENIYSNLKFNTEYFWNERYRDEYARLCENKVIINGALTTGTSFAEVEPTSKLTQKVLEKYYVILNRTGAGLGAMGKDNGRPVYMLITDAETSNDIILQAETRQDIRWSSQANTLLAPLGIDRSYRGFYHYIDVHAPRYNYNEGAPAGSRWERIYPFKPEATTNGTRWVNNPDYDNAEYTESYIYHKDVYTSLVVPPRSSAGGSTSFDPVNYRGEFKWVKFAVTRDNPDGDTGFYRAVFAQGSKPVQPRFGYAIRHKRCPNDLGLVGCY